LEAFSVFGFFKLLDFLNFECTTSLHHSGEGLGKGATNNKQQTYYMSWHKIAETSTDLFVDGNPLVEISLGEKKVCIIKWKDEIKACAEKCPHAGAKMVNGYLDALGNIVCPLHKYKFNLEKGRNVTGEGYFLKTYIVEQRSDGIYINL